MDEKFVVVDRVVGELQGQIIKGLLTASGINAQVFEQGGAREIGVAGLSEVDVVVPAEQEAEARVLLEAYYAGDLEEKSEEEADQEDLE